MREEFKPRLKLRRAGDIKQTDHFDSLFVKRHDPAKGAAEQP